MGLVVTNPTEGNLETSRLGCRRRCRRDDADADADGGQEGTVLNTTGGVLVAETPSSTTGSVSVVVTTQTHTGSLSNAFTYYDDATGTGGVLGSLSWYELVGNYWSSSDAWGDASASFIQPADFHYWEFYTDSMDSCQLDTFLTSESLYVFDLEAGSIQLSTGSTSITLPWDESTLSYGLELSSGQYISNGWYDLEPLTDGPLAGLTMENMFRAGQSFSVSQPAIQGNAPPNISRSQTVRWSNANADWMLIYIAVMNSAGTAFESIVQCIAADDGEFTVNGNLLSSWPTNRQVNLYVAAVKEQGGNLPHNNAESRIVGSYFLVEAGWPVRRVDILGVGVHAIRRAELIPFVEQRVQNRQRTTLAYANVHVLNQAHGNPQLRSFLNQADLCYCDGNGVIKARRSSVIPCQKG